MKKLLLLLLLPASCLGAYTDFYVSDVGSALNSGHTTSASPIVTSVNGNWDATTGIFICNGATDLSGVVVGDWASVYLDAATAAVFVGRITAVDDTGDTVTVSVTYKMGNAPTTSATGRSIRIGGCWPFPNGNTTDVPFSLSCAVVGTVNAASNSPCINVKSNLYTTTAQITHAANWRVEGYLTNPHDNLGKPVVQSTIGPSYILADFGGNGEYVNMEWVCRFTSGTSAGLSVANPRQRFVRVVVSGCRGAAFNLASSNLEADECEAYNGLNSGFSATTLSTFLRNCVSHHNTTINGHGFSTTAGVFLFGCIAYANAGSGFICPSGLQLSTWMNCDAYENSLSGFDLSAGQSVFGRLINCNSFKNGLYGFAADLNTSGELLKVVFGTGTQTNVSGSVSPDAYTRWQMTSTNLYTLNQTPWVNPTNANFSIIGRPNIGSGLGYFLQQTQALNNLTIGYPDIGAAQSRATNFSGGGSFTWSQ